MVAPRAILFDLDDTLLDRARTFEKYVPRFAARYRDSLDSCDQSLLRDIILDADGVGYRPRAEMARVLIERLPWRDKPSVDELVAAYRAEFLACAHLSESAHELLDDLRARGIKTGMITNGESEVQRRKLDRLDLTRQMDAIVISAEFGVKKPDPSIFRFALDKLGVAAREAWFVGDHPEFDILAAESVGIKAFWIARMTPWPADRAPCERRIDSLADVLRLVQISAGEKPCQE